MASGPTFTDGLWICRSCLARIQPKARSRKFSSKNTQRRQAEEPVLQAKEPMTEVIGTFPASRVPRAGPNDTHARSTNHSESRRTTMQQLARIVNLSTASATEHLQSSSRTTQSEAARKRARLVQAIQQKNIAEVFSLFDSRATDDAFVTSIPNTTWSQILALADATYSSPPLHKHHRSFNPARLRQVNYSYARAIEVFAETIIRTIRMRRSRGMRMALADYRVLFRLVAKKGDASLIRVLWNEMKKEDFEPDLECYDAYMQAITWEEDMRTSPGRRMVQKPKDDTIGTTRMMVKMFEEGALSEVRRIFEMTRANGIMPSTDSYCFLMTALSRDGYFHEVEQILLETFKIDVNSIANGTVDESPKLQPNSHVRHTNRLLVTIAEVFGEANKIALALSVIDYISRTYKIPITRNVWYKLSQWTWIQARIKPWERLPGDRDSPMQLTNVQALGNIMASAPYHTHPTAPILDIMTRSGAMSTTDYHGSRFDKLLLQMDRMRLEYISLLRRLRLLDFRNEKLSTRRHISVRRMPTISPLHQQKLNNLRTSKRMMFIALQRLARKLVSNKGFQLVMQPLAQETNDWRMRGISEFILQWSSFLPDTIKYMIDTGYLEITIRFEADKRVQGGRKRTVARKKSFVWLDAYKLIEPWTFRVATRNQRRKLVGEPRILPRRVSLPAEEASMASGGRGMFAPSYEESLRV